MTRFARALSLSSRLLAAACSTAIAGVALLTTPGCISRCYEYDTLLEVIREESPTTATLRGVAVWSTNAIAVGDGGVIAVRDAEGGWTTRESGTAADLRAVTFNGAGSVALAVGAGGTVLRRDADGVTWNTIDVGVAADLNAIWFGDDQQVVAVGEGVILHSDDGGATWAPATVPEGTAGLNGVAARQGEVGLEWVAVGDAGTVLTSSDGLTWTKVDVGMDAELRSVALGSLDIGEGWVIVAASQVFRGPIDGLEAAALEPVGELHAVSGSADYLVGADGAVRALEYGMTVGGYTLAGDDVEGARLLAVADGDVVLAVGEGGAIARVEQKSYQSDSHLCNGTVVEGRPFTVDDEVRTAEPIGRDDWCEDIEVAALPAATRGRLAEAWARDGLYEHASVASFARFVLQLLAVGAPPELIVAGQAALADEVRHARACFGLASAYAETPIGPGPLAVEGSMNGPCDLATLAAATAIEGCVNETIAALVASTAAELAEDRAVRSRLMAIAADERRHAALAWRTVAWALGRGDAAVRQAVVRAFALPPMLDDEAGEDGLEAHGRLSRRAREAVARVAWRDIIAPQAAALLSGPGVGAPAVAQA